MKRGLKIAMMAVLGIGAILLFGLVVQLLWNWLVPEIIGWKAITYIQAMGLLLLCQILFKGFVFNGGSRWNNRWNHRWKEKWQEMSPEQREIFKQKMRDKCGWGSE